MPHRILAEVQLPDFKDRPQKEGDILRKAEELFLQFGFHRVSVEEICREANVSKATFYKYFANKFAVLEVYMKERLRVGMKTFDRIIASEAGMPEKMRAMVAMKASAVSKFTPVFLNSLQGKDESILRLMQEWTAMGEAAMRTFFVESQARGEIHPEYNVDFLLHVWMALGMEARSEAIHGIYGDDYVKLSRDFMNFLCFGTTGPPAADN